MKTSILLFKYVFIVSVILIALSLFNCEDAAERPEIQFDSLTINNYPEVDGSTSAHPLQVIIACRLLGVEYSWMPSWFDETYRIWPSPDEIPEIAAFIRDSINHSGTHTAYTNLINGIADIIIVARSASDDEIDLANHAGIELIITPIALDAFVFIANINNPVNALTTQQIQDIYTGNITHWNEVGGISTKINPYTREPNSGSQELMLDLVMKDLQMPDYPDMILYGMMGPINRITSDRDGLGYTVYFFEQFMAPNDNLKLLAVNGINPEYNTLRKKQYIYTTDVFTVIRKDLDSQSNAYRLYQWLQTYNGQKVIEESGYIPYY
jgi:phosphate transport system substrate-binding protein